MDRKVNAGLLIAGFIQGSTEYRTSKERRCGERVYAWNRGEAGETEYEP